MLVDVNRLEGELRSNRLGYLAQLQIKALTRHLKSARAAPWCLHADCNCDTICPEHPPVVWLLVHQLSLSCPQLVLLPLFQVVFEVFLTPTCHFLGHFKHHLCTAVNSKPNSAVNPKLDQLLQPLPRELSDSPEQMAPDLSVADQPKQTRRGSTGVEKGVRVEEKENGKNLAVGEAFKPWSVISFQVADVNLSQFVERKTLFQDLLEILFLTCSPSFDILSENNMFSSFNNGECFG